MHALLLSGHAIPLNRAEFRNKDFLLNFTPCNIRACTSIFDSLIHIYKYEWNVCFIILVIKFCLIVLISIILHMNLYFLYSRNMFREYMLLESMFSSDIAIESNSRLSFWMAASWASIATKTKYYCRMAATLPLSHSCNIQSRAATPRSRSIVICYVRMQQVTCDMSHWRARVLYRTQAAIRMGPCVAHQCAATVLIYITRIVYIIPFHLWNRATVTDRQS